MATYKMAKLTDAGRELLQKTNIGLSETSIIAVKTSDSNYNESDIAELTDLENVKQIMPIQTYDIVDENKIAVSVTFTNETLTEGYYVRTFGVFAKDAKNDGEEILYEIVSADESRDSAIYIPPFTEGIPYSVSFKLIIVVSDSADITVQVSPEVFVTVELFHKTIEQLRNGVSGVYVGDNAPENTGMLWIDTGNGGVSKYFNGTIWVTTKAVWG